MSHMGGVESERGGARGTGDGPHAALLGGRRSHWFGNGTSLAWEYVLPRCPMIRRVDTLEVHGARWGLRKMLVDVSIPDRIAAEGQSDGGRGARRCFVPVALLNKSPVAADLEVWDGTGAAVPVPTKIENMALTALAFAEISKHGGQLFSGDPQDYELSADLQAIVGDVIRKQPRDARVCRLEIAKNMVCPAHEWLIPLLRRLEDHFMLWVPVEGVPGTECRIEISRGDARVGNSIFPLLRRKGQPFVVQSAIKPIAAEWDAPRRWLRGFRVTAAVGQLLVPLGLTPVKFQHEALEASRFSSYHLRVIPPKGLLIRDVRSGEIPDDEWDSEKYVVTPLTNDVDRSIQGADTRMAHVHLSMLRNPSRLYSRIMIGLRPGTTTLWALVTVLTAGLLWAFHRKVNELAEPGFHLDIAVAVLLVGPTFASAWTLRDNDRALLRSMLAGTRLLLLASAALSVATALALAGLRPFDWPIGKTVEWYASASFAIAAFIATGWLHARSLTWFIYRDVLTRTRWNLLAIATMAASSSLVISELHDFSIGVSLLFATGFGYAAIAGNRISVPLGQESRLPAVLAGFGAILTLGISARELGLYNRIVDRGVSHEYGIKLEVAIAAMALLAFCVESVRASLESRNRKRKHSPLSVPASGGEQA